MISNLTELECLRLFQNDLKTIVKETCKDQFRENGLTSLMDVLVLYIIGCMDITENNKLEHQQLPTLKYLLCNMENTEKAIAESFVFSCNEYQKWTTLASPKFKEECYMQLLIILDEWNLTHDKANVFLNLNRIKIGEHATIVRWSPTKKEDEQHKLCDYISGEITAITEKTITIDTKRKKIRIKKDSICTLVIDKKQEVK